MNAGSIRLLALRHDDERLTAATVAILLKRRAYGLADIFIDGLSKHLGSRRLAWELIADAIKNADKFEPAPQRRRQIESYDAAWCKHCGDDIANVPTTEQWKHEFKRLFPKEKVPSDSTLKRTSRELGLLLPEASIGRPPGSRDKQPRERRARRNSRQKDFAKSRSKKVLRGY